MKITRRQLRQIIREQSDDARAQMKARQDAAFADFESMRSGSAQQSSEEESTLAVASDDSGRPQFSEEAKEIFDLDQMMDIDPLYNRLKAGKEDQVDALVVAFNQAVQDYSTLESFPKRPVAANSEISMNWNNRSWSGVLGGEGAPGWVKAQFTVWSPGESSEKYVRPESPSQGVEDMQLKLMWKMKLHDHLQSLIYEKAQTLQEGRHMKITRKQLRHLILQETRHALREQGLA